MNERNLKEFKVLLTLLFGKRSAENLVEKFLRSKQVECLFIQAVEQQAR